MKPMTFTDFAPDLRCGNLTNSTPQGGPCKTVINGAMERQLGYFHPTCIRRGPDPTSYKVVIMTPANPMKNYGCKWE